MVIYLIKSIVCLAILMGFYHTVLESENAHKFKRFYLLIGIVFAFIIPLVTFTTYTNIDSQTVVMPIQSLNSLDTSDTKSIDINWSVLLWSVYSIGATLFAIRFILNLRHIRQTIILNPILKASFYNKVLLKTPVVPHSFFNFIFFNKSAFENALIPPDVITHEEGHVKQKHSIDILIVELLQILFWFNPLLILVKKAIKLNHEFLADAHVISSNKDVTTYQNLLVNYSKCTDHTALTSPLNYSLTKKRIIMLSKNTSKNKWVKLGLVLPLLAGLTYGFSTKRTVVTPIENQPKTKTYIAKTLDETTTADKHIDLVVTASVIILNDDVVSLKSLTKRIDKLTKSWTDAELKDYDLNVSFNNVDKDRRQAIEKAFKNSRLGKANPDAPFFMPPPPPPRHDNDEERYIERVERQEKRLERMEERSTERRHREEERMQEMEIHRKEMMKDREAMMKDREIMIEERRVLREDAMKDREMVTVERRVLRDKAHANEPMPPMPPPPPSPINIVEEFEALAKENATFYYEGKAITSDKAIAIVKDSKDINIQIKDDTKKAPVVKLSKSPIKLKKE